MEVTNASKPSGGKNRTLLYVGLGIGIIVVAAVLILSLNKGSDSVALASYDNQPVPASLMAKLNIPENISDAIGIGGANTQILKINGTPALADGKPMVLYIGAEFCPYCGFQRWAMIVALSRFGTFSNVKFMTSSANDVFANTPTFSFYNSTYTSNYITFVPVETTTNEQVSIDGVTEYQPLQVPNASENVTFNRYDPGGGIPFMFFANKTVINGVSYSNPGVLDSNWTTIAGNLYNTSTAQSQAVVGAADLLTEQICQIDGNQPANVCGQPYVSKIKNQVG
jgi:hypothetical protein